MPEELISEMEYHLYSSVGEKLLLNERILNESYQSARYSGRK